MNKPKTLKSPLLRPETNPLAASLSHSQESTPWLLWNLRQLRDMDFLGQADNRLRQLRNWSLPVEKIVPLDTIMHASQLINARLHTTVQRRFSVRMFPNVHPPINHEHIIYCGTIRKKGVLTAMEEQENRPSFWRSFLRILWPKHPHLTLR